MAASLIIYCSNCSNEVENIQICSLRYGERYLAWYYKIWYHCSLGNAVRTSNFGSWSVWLATAVPAPTTTTVVYVAASAIMHFWRRTAPCCRRASEWWADGFFVVLWIVIFKYNSNWPASNITASVRQDAEWGFICRLHDLRFGFLGIQQLFRCCGLWLGKSRKHWKTAC